MIRQNLARLAILLLPVVALAGCANSAAAPAPNPTGAPPAPVAQVSPGKTPVAPTRTPAPTATERPSATPTPRPTRTPT
ncbi:MAG: hypothetical protein D6768_17705, partial [Chloroflexi bacterium]